MNVKLYCDYAAQKPLLPEVKRAIQSFAELSDYHCNPSAIYKNGRKAHACIENAREAVARAIGADKEEIYFTSGSTEAINWIMRTAIRNNIITTQIEHSAININAYEREDGRCVFTLPVDTNGRIETNYLERYCNERSIAIIGYVNNEIGTIQPIEEITKICHDNDTLIFVDGTQVIGQIPINVHKIGMDYMCGSFHKLGGLSGCGFLYCKKGSPLEPLFLGGQQENGMRAGTENLLGIITGGIAIERSVNDLENHIKRTTAIRDTIISELLKIPDSHLNGSMENRVCNNINISFADINADNLILLLDTMGIQCSTGSACNSLSIEPSHVLEGIQTPDKYLFSSIRITIDDNMETEQIDYLIDSIKVCINKLKKMIYFF